MTVALNKLLLYTLASPLELFFKLRQAKKISLSLPFNINFRIRLSIAHRKVPCRDVDGYYIKSINPGKNIFNRLSVFMNMSSHSRLLRFLKKKKTTYKMDFPPLST